MFTNDQRALSKEAIASRMFRNAARFWGLNDTNTDNFDPLVRLLIEACAVEVYRIDNEMASLQRSMTERLASLIIPEVHVQPRPAHGIIHARATDRQMYVALESQFQYQKRVASVANGPLDKSVDLFFSPAGRYKTVNGDVVLLATSANIYRQNELQQKETFLRTAFANPVAPQTAWIGIDIDPNQDLTDLSLFFDLKNTPDKAHYLSMLRHVQCTCNDRPVQLSQRLSETSFEDHHLPFEDALEELYINRRLERQINRAYAANFQTITAEGNEPLSRLDASMFQRLPRELEASVADADLQKLSKELLWLKLSFPPEFTPAILDDLTIAINCFPIVNRHLNELSYRLNSYFNIIPLLTGEQFFAVKSVEGTIAGAKGRSDYVYYPFDRYNNNEKGIYTVRVGDLERFDARNAAEYLNYLVELLRDESRAFAAFGQDFMSTAIKDLNQNIGVIDQKIRQNLHLLHNTPTYLLINPMQEGDTIFVQYWTSNGEGASGIRSGSAMSLYEGSSFQKQSLVLMTQTTGGTDKLKNTEVLTAFKSVLLSRNRIVTAADIKNFCAAHLQDKVSDIRIEKGVGISAMPDQGLMPVVNVVLTANMGKAGTDWERVKLELLAELKNESVIDANYAIVVI